MDKENFTDEQRDGIALTNLILNCIIFIIFMILSGLSIYVYKHRQYYLDALVRLVEGSIGKSSMFTQASAAIKSIAPYEGVIKQGLLDKFKEAFLPDTKVPKSRGKRNSK